ncbi:MAG: hypothetical protein M3342_23535, partial [Bacteroidota bacterium]|nr:hypothetical protein [Bacteroidota bacterium]
MQGYRGSYGYQGIKKKGKGLPTIQRIGRCLPFSTQKHGTSSLSLKAMVRTPTGAVAVAVSP